MKQLKMQFLTKVLPQKEIPNGYRVRKFRYKDTEAWLDICRHGLFPIDADISYAKAEFAKFPFCKEDDILLAEDETARPIATACGMLLPSGEGYLHWICAKPEARGTGLAAALVLKAAKILYDRGASAVFLTTDDHRSAAIKTYLKIGLCPVKDDADARARWQTIFRTLGIPDTNV